MDTNQTWPQRLAILRDLKEEYRRLDKIAKEAKNKHDAYQAAIFEKMRSEGLKTVSTDDSNFTARRTIYAQIHDSDALRDWLASEGLVDEFYVTKPVDQRLNEIVRDRIDQGIELPPGLSYYPKEYISIQERKDD